MRFYLDFLDALIFFDDLIPNLAINYDKGHLNLIHKYLFFFLRLFPTCAFFSL